MISAGPKQEFLLHATTIHLPTIKAIRSRKITKLGSLSLPHWFLTESSYIRIEKQTFAYSFGKRFRTVEIELIIASHLVTVAR